MFDAAQQKKQFPIFEKQPNLVFLDNASTTQKPQVVLEAMTDFYLNSNANIQRGVYRLAERADAAYQEARKTCAGWIGAQTEEIIFVKNATEAANLVAYSYGEITVQAGDNIVVTELEHHANYLPWQELATRKGAELRVIPIEAETGELQMSRLDLIDAKTRLVAVTMMSNVLGTSPDLSTIVKAAHRVGARVVLDAAQGAAHFTLDVKTLEIDFALVTGHKVFGPMGIGLLYGKNELLEQMPAWMTGGGMVKELPNHWLESPNRFEAGTPNVAGAVGLAAAINFIKNIKTDWQSHEKSLARMTREKLKEIPQVKIYPGSSSIVAFSLDGIHPHDIASVLAEDQVCIRAGHHCAKPLMKALEVQATARASFSLYNEEKDVIKLVEGIKKAVNIFK